MQSRLAQKFRGSAKQLRLVGGEASEVGEEPLFPEAEVEAEAEAEAEAEEEAEAEAEAEAEEVEAVEFWHRFEDVEGFSRIGCSITKGIPIIGRNWFIITP